MDRLREIFERQEEVSAAFMPVERASGLGLLAIAGDPPHDLADPRFQYVVRDYAWRVIEELAEALTAEEAGACEEELADVLHFFVELCLVLGMKQADLAYFSLESVFIRARHHDDWKMAVVEFMRTFAMAVEAHLKNKPWRQTPTPVNRDAFYEDMRSSFMALICVMKAHGLTAGSLHEAFMKKAKINLARAEAGR